MKGEVPDGLVRGLFQNRTKGGLTMLTLDVLPGRIQHFWKRRDRVLPIFFSIVLFVSALVLVFGVWQVPWQSFLLWVLATDVGFLSFLILFSFLDSRSFRERR